MTHTSWSDRDGDHSASTGTSTGGAAVTCVRVLWLSSELMTTLACVAGSVTTTGPASTPLWLTQPSPVHMAKSVAVTPAQPKMRAVPAAPASASKAGK